MPDNDYFYAGCGQKEQIDWALSVVQENARGKNVAILANVEGDKLVHVIQPVAHSVTLISDDISVIGLEKLLNVSYVFASNFFGELALVDKYDVIIYLECFSFDISAEVLLKHMYQLLVPGGLALLTLPVSYKEFSGFDIVAFVVSAVEMGFQFLDDIIVTPTQKLESGKSVYHSLLKKV